MGAIGDPRRLLRAGNPAGAAEASDEINIADGEAVESEVPELAVVRCLRVSLEVEGAGRGILSLGNGSEVADHGHAGRRLRALFGGGVEDGEADAGVGGSVLRVESEAAEQEDRAALVIHGVARERAEGITGGRFGMRRENTEPPDAEERFGFGAKLVHTNPPRDLHFGSQSPVVYTKPQRLILPGSVRGIIGSVTRLLAICPALTLLLCACGVSPTVPSTSPPGQESPLPPPPPPPPAPRAAAKLRKTTAGKFDFYVMSLSWSPGFCATPAGRNEPLQCGPGRRFAFVLHGLWPQYEKGGWPQNCSAEATDASVVNSMLTIMPSPKLVAHEWEKHGTCSGLSPKDYFEEATEAFHSVKIPPRYKAPLQQFTVSPDRLRQDFAAANPMIGDRGFVVLCGGNGRFLQEVRVCLTQELKGRPCNREVLRDACKSGQIIMRPLR